MQPLLKHFPTRIIREDNSGNRQFSIGNKGIGSTTYGFDAPLTFWVREGGYGVVCEIHSTMGVDGYDHDTVDLDQECHCRLVGCRSLSDGMPEGRDLLLGGYPGKQR